MDDKQIEELMERHGIRITANRLMIVRALANEDHPKSMKELEDTLVLIDKSNIFRTLTLFRKHHLVHTIEDGTGAIRYELCMSSNHEDDDDEHVHFFCEECGRTICLPSTPVPSVDLPEGYEHHSSNLLVKGICPNCAQKPHRHSH